MRRYTRSLTQIKTRIVEKAEPIGSTEVLAIPEKPSAMYDRLKFATLDVDGEDGAVVLAYMADKPELVSWAFPSETVAHLPFSEPPSKRCSAHCLLCYSTTLLPNSHSSSGSSGGHYPRPMEIDQRPQDTTLS